MASWRSNPPLENAFESILIYHFIIGMHIYVHDLNTFIENMEEIFGLSSHLNTSITLDLTDRLRLLNGLKIRNTFQPLTIAAVALSAFHVSITLVVGLLLKMLQSLHLMVSYKIRIRKKSQQHVLVIRRHCDKDPRRRWTLLTILITGLSSSDGYIYGEPSYNVNMSELRQTTKQTIITHTDVI